MRRVAQDQIVHQRHLLAHFASWAPGTNEAVRTQLAIIEYSIPYNAMSIWLSADAFDLPASIPTESLVQYPAQQLAAPGRRTTTPMPTGI
jgi:hypothetical protein